MTKGCKTIALPADSLEMASCVFTEYKLFLADTVGKKILQYSKNGTYEKVFATGFKFLRMTARNNLLYSTIWVTKNVRVYDASNGNIVNHFDVTTNDGRGLAFDKDGRLHVSTYGPTVEMFTSNGHKISQRTYSELELGDGLVIDSDRNTTDLQLLHRVLKF